MTRVLAFGASGLLGSNAVAVARGRGWRVVGTYLTADPTDGGVFADDRVTAARCDLTDAGRVDELLDRHDPDAVVNCAALADVDACESDPDRARAVNAEAPGRLAAACAERGASFVHVSTDYVFDGRDPPYDETDDPNPLQTYGATKRAGDRAVRESNPDALLVRPSFVWGVDRVTDSLAGFPAWVAGRVREGGTAPLFVDQRVTPSRAGAVAETTFDLLDVGASGTYHVAARDCVAPFEFGRRVARLVDGEGRVERSSAAAVDRAAPRPAETCLDVGRVARELGRDQPTLAADLDAVEREGAL